MRVAKPVTGMFANTRAYARWGDGPQTLLLIPGGPGNDAPTGQTLRMMGRPLRPLVESGYSLWMVARRRDMPAGHTIDGSVLGVPTRTHEAVAIVGASSVANRNTFRSSTPKRQKPAGKRSYSLTHQATAHTYGARRVRRPLNRVWKGFPDRVDNFRRLTRSGPRSSNGAVSQGARTW